MSSRRIYRVTSSRAPRLLFELSRIGDRAGAATETIQVEQERYRVGEAQVSIEHVAPLGWFCVIAAASTAGAAELADRLALDPADLEPRGYVELLGASGAARPGARAKPRLTGRSLRLTLVASATAAVALLDVPLGALLAVVLLLLEWGFGEPSPRGSAS